MAIQRELLIKNNWRTIKEQMHKPNTAKENILENLLKSNL